MPNKNKKSEKGETMTETRINFLGLPLDVNVDANAVCDMLRKKSSMDITFINPSAWAVAQKDTAYARALGQMSLVLADGIAVAAACQKLTGEDCKRVSFDMTSLADPFFKTMADKKMSVILVGGRPGIADNVAAKLLEHYPNLIIAECMHGFGEFESKIEHIKAKAPDAVIIAMGLPRQEAFQMQLREAKFKGLSITCGGFFDQYLEAEGTQYYPAWINRFHLRFAYRLFKEPGRLWRRYLIEYQLFFKLFGKAAAVALIEQGKSLLSRPLSKRT